MEGGEKKEETSDLKQADNLEENKEATDSSNLMLQKLEKIEIENMETSDLKQADNLEENKEVPDRLLIEMILQKLEKMEIENNNKETSDLKQADNLEENQETSDRIEIILQKLEKMETKLEKMETKLGNMEKENKENFQKVANNFQTVENNFQTVENNFQKVEKSINDSKEEIIARLERLESGKVAVDADVLAERVTVAIFSDGESEPLGHGILIKRNEEYFLLSAAHVLVFMDDKVNLCWSSMNDNKTVQANVVELYLEKRYVSKGTHDIGLAKVLFDKDYELMGEDVKINQKQINLGTTVIAHGHIYLRGLMVQIHNKLNRVMFESIPVAGCNGCPLFNNDLELVAIVHGYTKHRGCMTIQNYCNKKYVYGDIITQLNDYEFFKVKDDISIRTLLQEAENLSEEDAIKTDQKYTIGSDECKKNCKSLTNIVNTFKYFNNVSKSFKFSIVEGEGLLLSWDDLMEEIANQSFLEERLESISERTLTCLCPIF